MVEFSEARVIKYRLRQDRRRLRCWGLLLARTYILLLGRRLMTFSSSSSINPTIVFLRRKRDLEQLAIKELMYTDTGAIVWNNGVKLWARSQLLWKSSITSLEGYPHRLGYNSIRLRHNHTALLYQIFPGGDSRMWIMPPLIRLSSNIFKTNIQRKTAGLLDIVNTFSVDKEQHRMSGRQAVSLVLESRGIGSRIRTT